MATGPIKLPPVAPVEAPAAARPAGDARDEALARLTQLPLGKEQRATVLARLSDGQFLVRIANAGACMPLPAGTEVGDDIRLTLVGIQPRPIFRLGAAPGSSDPDPSFSKTGRLIDQIRQQAQQHGMPLRLLGAGPLLPPPASGTLLSARHIAAALQDTLGTSGLFYESHVSEWANGERTLQSLHREPQAALVGARPEPGNRNAGLETMDGLSDHASDGSATLPTRVLLPAAPLEDAQMARLVSLQLELLEHNRTAWEGDLWPGFPLQWEVAKEDHGAAAGPASGETVWKSKVRFELPKLGTVTANLRLQGERVSIQLSASASDTAALLNSKGETLASALEAAGSTLDLLTVKQDEHA